MTSTEVLALLQEFSRERAALWVRHIARSRHVGNLDFNNTYQYVISREETHLAWVQSAIEELGGTVSPAGAEPTAEPPARQAVAAFFADDARTNAAFIDKWQGRVETVTNARDRGMLRVMLGEMREHQRFFEQAAAGRDDLLGRRVDAGSRRGEVIASRWVGE